MLISLLLAPATPAMERDYEFGGRDDSAAWTMAYNCWEVTATVDVHWFSLDSTAAAADLLAWQEVDGEYELVHRERDTEREADVDWRLEAGSNWCLGQYAAGSGYVRSGAGTDDAEWASCLGYCFHSADSVYDTPNCLVTVTGCDVHMSMTIEAIDEDGDGHDSIDDCDDADASRNPDVEEVYYDGIDSDCDGRDDYDQDHDGDPSDEYGGGDCDDTDRTVSSLAAETWYDGTDGDCAGGDDYDRDGDGDRSDDYGGTDCDDRDEDVNPGEQDAWYDGVDQDCDGADDYDKDGDGDRSDAHGGGDCDDEDPAVSSEAEEIWYDGIDQDCDGADDYDKDGDGAVTGDDCDDEDPGVIEGCPDDEPGTAGGKDDGQTGGCFCTGGASLIFLPLVWGARRRRA